MKTNRQKIPIFAMRLVATLGLSMILTTSSVAVAAPVDVSFTSTPAAGSVLKGGVTSVLKFSTNQYSSVTSSTLYYSKDGVTYSAIATGVITGSSSSYNWVAPQDNTSKASFRLQVVFSQRTTVTKTSSTFGIDSLSPVVSSVSLKDTANNILTSVEMGKDVTIAWSATDANMAANPISIEFSSDNGLTWSSVANGLSNSGSYSWLVPNVLTSFGRLRVTAVDKVGNAPGSFTSAAFSVAKGSSPALSLVTFGPNSNSKLVHPGVPSTIAWNAKDSSFGSTPIKIEFSKDNGMTWETLVAAMENSGAYSWIPNSTMVCSKCLLRITATNSAGLSTVAQSVNFVSDTSVAFNFNAYSLYTVKHPGFNPGDIYASHTNIADYLQIPMPSNVIQSPTPLGGTLSGAYIPDLGGVNIYNVYGPRILDFGGGKSFFSSYKVGTATYKFSNALTFNTVDPVTNTSQTWTELSAKYPITDNGVPGRIERLPAALKVAYVANDAVVAGKCRNEINSFSYESKKRQIWDFSVQLGNSAKEMASWPNDSVAGTLPNGNPTLIAEWNATPNAMASISMSIEEDNLNPNKLRLFMAYKPCGNAAAPNKCAAARIFQLGNLNRFEPIDIIVDSYADFDPTGWIKLYVNGVKYALSGGSVYPALTNFDSGISTINTDATIPQRFTFGVYMYNQATPANYNRETYWYRVRALAP